METLNIMAKRIYLARRTRYKILLLAADSPKSIHRVALDILTTYGVKQLFYSGCYIMLCLVLLSIVSYGANLIAFAYQVFPQLKANAP